jgi:hypothetical protein
MFTCLCTYIVCVYPLHQPDVQMSFPLPLCLRKVLSNANRISCFWRCKVYQVTSPRRNRVVDTDVTLDLMYLVTCMLRSDALPSSSKFKPTTIQIHRASFHCQKKVVKSSPRWLVKGLTTELDARTAKLKIERTTTKRSKFKRISKPRFMFLTEDSFARGKMSKCSDTSNREADRIRQCAFTTYQTFFCRFPEKGTSGKMLQLVCSCSSESSRASLSSDRFCWSPHLLPFLFCKCFSSHKFPFLEYHNLYTQFWCIISIYRFCHIIFKHNFYSRKTYAYNLYAQLIENNLCVYFSL